MSDTRKQHMLDPRTGKETAFNVRTISRKQVQLGKGGAIKIDRDTVKPAETPKAGVQKGK